jgi:hypothetical protein
MVAKKTNSTDVEKFQDKAQVQTWDDAIAFLAEQGYDVQTAEQTEQALGDGFEFMRDKNQLVNVPFIVLDYKQGFSERYNTPYCTVWAMTGTNKRVKFIDMSTGIAADLMSATSRGYKPQGMIFRQGLTSSSYDVKDDAGNKTGETGTTFYLNVG